LSASSTQYLDLANQVFRPRPGQKIDSERGRDSLNGIAAEIAQDGNIATHIGQLEHRWARNCSTRACKVGSKGHTQYSLSATTADNFYGTDLLARLRKDFVEQGFNFGCGHYLLRMRQFIPDFVICAP
jgi:hypothetical protein